jgi:protein ImuA
LPSAPLPDLGFLAPARVHEATGAGRLTFALALAGRLGGAVLWVQDARSRDGLYAPGMAALMDPARLVLARPTGALPVLQATEEALRSGAAPLVVAELAEAPDLTASRRLQLAAGTGGGRGLCLVPEARLRTNAAETRWRCAPVAGGGQRWEIVKNKRGRLGVWEVCLVRPAAVCLALGSSPHDRVA